MAETEAELAARFGARIRTSRKKRRWSQAVLAERLDVSLDYVGALERGERLPSFPVAIRVANLFETPLAAMLASEAPVAEPAEPWLEEATAILRSLVPPARTIVLTMLRAASGVREPSGASKDAGARKRRP